MRDGEMSERGWAVTIITGIALLLATITILGTRECNRKAMIERECVERGGVITTSGGCAWSREATNAR